ncbi:MAG: hypothetical protein O3C20_17350 [Verrucomicrobia bacterium]|nr:hypothetical protein [Verrucomicrobiota bacterium]
MVRPTLNLLTQQRLEIDLDDGVKQNYPNFGKALDKVPRLFRGVLLKIL